MRKFWNRLKITFPDGSVKTYERGVSSQEILKNMGNKLRKEAIAARVNDVLTDLSAPLQDDCSLEIITGEHPDGQATYWHSTSHIMAHAVKSLYPEAKFGVGPSIDSGFYYDIDLPESLTPDHLLKIEKKMRQIVTENRPFVRKELTRDEAIALFTEKKESYKLELLQEIDGVASTYTEGDFTDLCTGPPPPLSRLCEAFQIAEHRGRILARR